MADKTLEDMAAMMRGIDIAMLATTTDGGDIAARPMSNNGEVEYDGTSVYFTWQKSRMCADIAADDHVGLTFTGRSGLLGTHAIYIAVEGRAEVVMDKAEFAEHWTKDLDVWFKDGIDTPGLAMIRVSAYRITYWDGMDSGTLLL